MNPRHVIELSPSGTTFEAGDELLLDAMLASGLPVPFSCRRGACGSCKVVVTQGQYRAKQLAPGAPAPSYPLAANEMLLCQSHACADMHLEIPGWSLDTPALVVEATVLSKRALSADIIELVVMPDMPLAVRAGQYLKFCLVGGDSRCFSIANLPAESDGSLEFQIRRVSGGLFSETLLDGLEAGDLLQLEGPFGACTWQDDDAAPVVLFATGTGYAGIKPILSSALKRAVDVTFYWGGAQAADFYDRDFLDQSVIDHPRFHWHPILASEGRVQDVALSHGHPWQAAQVYACGNGSMISQARAGCLEAGVPSHRFIAEAFVPSGRSSADVLLDALDETWEKVGPRYSLDGMLAAREKTVRALAAIASQLTVGMTTGAALQMAAEQLQAMGASHTWHPTYIRFGDDTIRPSREGIDPLRELRASDIVVVDLGPVWDGYEGDYGDTFIFGEAPLHLACRKALHEVFDETREAWLRGMTGCELYDFAEARAVSKGWRLSRNLAGHRIADFPHALFGDTDLAELQITPSEMVWVLEIQLCHPTLAIGGFFEDILMR